MRHVVLAMTAMIVSCGDDQNIVALDGAPADAKSLDASDATPEAGARCKETIAAACVQDPTSCNTAPDQWSIDWSANHDTCLFNDCGDWIIIEVEGPPDSNDYSYIFDAKSGALLEIDVSSWSLEKNFCLAGPAQPYPLPSYCPLTRSCNAGCSITPGECSYGNEDGRVCGPTTSVTTCDGSQESFEECDCMAGEWFCTTSDAGSTFASPCDAGTD